eukprot:1152019-Pelagomonas_calceolata.AAC.2
MESPVPDSLLTRAALKRRNKARIRQEQRLRQKERQKEEANSYASKFAAAVAARSGRGHSRKMTSHECRVLNRMSKERPEGQASGRSIILAHDGNATKFSRCKWRLF